MIVILKDLEILFSREIFWTFVWGGRKHEFQEWKLEKACFIN